LKYAGEEKGSGKKGSEAEAMTARAMQAVVNSHAWTALALSKSETI
jgi:hypothetical protein